MRGSFGSKGFLNEGFFQEYRIRSGGVLADVQDPLMRDSFRSTGFAVEGFLHKYRIL